MWAHPVAGYGFFPFFPIFPLLFLLIIIGGGLWFRARWHGGRHGTWGRYDEAEIALRGRFARGEIDAEEYRTRIEELRH